MAQHDDIEARQAQREAERLAAFEEDLLSKAILSCASTPEGRMLLWWLLQQGRVGTQPFTSNALTTAFQCGELNVGNIILDRIIRVDPAIYVRLQQENLNGRDPNGADRADD